MTKKAIAALCMLSLLNLTALKAGPIEQKKPFSSSEILTLSHLQVASEADVREVEAGLLGAANGLINLALYGALIYAGIAVAQNISDDD